jgi:hypothetical protein
MPKFKVEIQDVEAFGDGSYHTTLRVAFGKSPKQAFERVNSYGLHQWSGGHPEGYGGTPVLQCRTIWCGSKEISRVWD